MVGSARQRRKPLAIKWKKDDVIKKFREAMTSPGPQAGQTGQKPNALQAILDKKQQKIKILGQGEKLA